MLCEAYALIDTGFFNSYDFAEILRGLGYSEDVVGKPGSTWWLRSPGDSHTSACVVYADGRAGYGCRLRVDNLGYGVRPALWVSADAVTLASEEN